MTSASIRIDRKAHERLKAIAAKEHVSLSNVVEELITLHERDEFRRSLDESFRSLREDPAEWRAYQQEAELWEQMDKDGLENEPHYDDTNQ